MLQMVQLQDGRYKLTIDYNSDSFAIHREWIFELAESDAEPLENGERIILEFK